MAPALLSVSTSKVTPVIRLKRGSIELVMDEKLERPLLRISGKKAKEVYAILTRRFLTRERDGCSEVLILLTALPAVSIWLLASYADKPSEELLDELVGRTPKVIADLFWDLVELSQRSYERKGGKPFIDQLIDHRITLKASKVVRALLELYNVRWRLGP
ncbi:MAG: hypothetical protein NO076_05380 [Sulfolobales archaeon]|nr:hypothetical protein [Sulfolobales archaeon]